MDEKTFHDSLHQLAEDALPSNQDPWPALRLRLASALLPSQQGDRSMDNQAHTLVEPKLYTRPGQPGLRLAAAFTLVVMLLAAAVIVTPQGRAWAQHTLGLFVRTEEKSFPLSSEQIEVANPEAQEDEANVIALQPTAEPPESLLFFEEACQNLGGEAAALCQVRQAQVKAGFALRLPPLAGSHLFLSSLALDTLQGSVQAGYGYQGYPVSGNSVIVRQGLGDFPAESDWQKVPEEYVQVVSVSGQPAEYVEGSFVVKPGQPQATWENSIPMARLRWREGERWFEIFKAGAPERVTFMDKTGMIQMAEGLTAISPGK